MRNEMLIIGINTGEYTVDRKMWKELELEYIEKWIIIISEEKSRSQVIKTITLNEKFLIRRMKMVILPLVGQY